MTDTVTIPADVAREVAEFVRDRVDFEKSITARLAMRRAVDLLDPQESLLERVAEAINDSIGNGEPRGAYRPEARVALRIVRDAIEALTPAHRIGARDFLDAAAVRRLLDGAES